ncbi:type II secretion system protein GspL [uncultured Paraglaciecola sp.]|uniref:type II secretion system protein GspL n=1 Tax=uncultured Paraglaciecola sp. TaxID=1765024 RepID=UPI002599CF55|nr:type II secretion system protein GspL [uncultured Paraglaciecola sp.]
MEQLVVRLGASSQEPIHWLVWSSQQNEIIASGELPSAEHLATLADRAGGRPICALVPTSDILLKWVTLPAKAGRKAIAAIPFMLEEDISGDIYEQFFALGPKKGDKQAVAIMQKTTITAWLELIQEAGLNCDQMLPDILALPRANEEAWSILELGEQLLIRQDDWAGLQGEVTWLKQALNHQARRNETPLQVSDYSGVDLADIDNLEVTSQPLELPMKVLASGAKNSTFNLLQGEFKVNNKKSGSWRKWRVAAVLAIIALSTTLIDKSLEQQRVSKELASLKEQTDKAYKSAFPNSGAYRDLRRTMTRQMQSLEQGGGGTSMLVMLNQLESAFGESKVKPQTLRFDKKRTEIRLQVIAANIDALDKFKRQAEAQGFEVEQGAINQKGSQVVGTLSVRS